ncbi:MAG: hypothetical protein LBD58_09950 [Treponema sp.]|nr:hypothetical protein [Treponema sp.]
MKNTFLTPELVPKPGWFCHKLIDEFIREHGRILAIDPNKRKDNERPPLDPAEQEGHVIRATVEQANAHLKDRLIPRSI